MPMATKVTNLKIMSTLKVDGKMTITGTTPAPASNQGGSKDPVAVGSKDPVPAASSVNCGFPVKDMLQWQFIDIRRCAHCHFETQDGTVSYVSKSQISHMKEINLSNLNFRNHASGPRPSKNV